jgi:hypothetical protein
MPTIAESTGTDISGYTYTLPGPPATQFQDQPLLPTRDSKLRFTPPYLPGIFPSSDALLGYHLGGMMPQYRIPVPPQATAQGASTSTATAIVTTSSSSSTNNPAKAQTASLTTLTLNPGDQFTGVLTMAKAFVVLTVTVNVPARVRLYSTVSAQTADLTRPFTQGPGYGTEQGIIGDIVLDTAPAIWQAVNMVGANGDSPQSATIYCTVDNISNASETVTASVVYVPVQS